MEAILNYDVPIGLPISQSTCLPAENQNEVLENESSISEADKFSSTINRY